MNGKAMTAASMQDLIDFAHKLANAASGVTLPLFRSAMTADHKGDAAFDPVTRADRDAEAKMREMIETAFPSHGVIGEEYGEHNQGADYTWVLDPIDGTRAYILGLPLWGTLIGLSHEGKPLLGLMDQPFTAERFWSDERAAWYRGPHGPLTRCQTRRSIALASAFLTASSPDMFAGADLARFDNLAAAVRMRRFGGDCYSYCMLALGHIDIVAEASLKPFDISPLIPIVEKAGGVVKSWTGGDASSGGNCVACGDPALLDGVLERLAASA